MVAAGPGAAQEGGCECDGWIAGWGRVGDEEGEDDGGGPREIDGEPGAVGVVR